MLKCLYNKEELGVEHMKKKSVINLIKYHAESNDAGFRSEAYEIAKDLASLRLSACRIYYGIDVKC